VYEWCCPAYLPTSYRSVSFFLSIGLNLLGMVKVLLDNTNFSNWLELLAELPNQLHHAIFASGIGTKLRTAVLYIGQSSASIGRSLARSARLIIG
jgi:hypothetical protein